VQVSKETARRYHGKGRIKTLPAYPRWLSNQDGIRRQTSDGRGKERGGLDGLKDQHHLFARKVMSDPGDPVMKGVPEGTKYIPHRRGLGPGTRGGTYIAGTEGEIGQYIHRKKGREKIYRRELTIPANGVTRQKFSSGGRGGLEENSENSVTNRKKQKDSNIARAGSVSVGTPVRKEKKVSRPGRTPRIRG